MLAELLASFVDVLLACHTFLLCIGSSEKAAPQLWDSPIIILFWRGGGGGSKVGSWYPWDWLGLVNTSDCKCKHKHPYKKRKSFPFLALALKFYSRDWLTQYNLSFILLVKNNKERSEILNSAFVWWEELCRYRRPLPRVSYNTLLDLHNSLYHTQPHSKVINYTFA